MPFHEIECQSKDLHDLMLTSFDLIKNMISTEVAHNPKLGGRTNQGQFRLENYLGPLFFFHVYCFRLDFSLKPQYAVLQEYSNILIKFLSRA